MSNRVEFLHVVPISTDARDPSALAARLHRTLTRDTYRVPIAQPLPGVTVGAKVRLVLLLADGKLGWSTEGYVAAKVEGRSISVWRDGASVEGPVAGRLAELSRDWDVTTVPSHSRPELRLDQLPTVPADGGGDGWDEETEVRDDEPDVSFAPTTLELPLDVLTNH
jgi:hypothetical protein